MRYVVALSDVPHITHIPTWLKPFALVFHSHPIHGHAQRSLSVFSPSLSTSCSTFSSSFSSMTDGDSVTINTLCNSANGTFVTLDDYLPITKNQGTKQRVQRILGDCWQWETNGQCVKGDNCSFRHDMNKRGESSPSNPSQNSFMQQNERNASRTRSPRGRSPSGRMSRWPCKDYLRGTCNNSFCERWHPPECLFYKTKSGCRFGEKCSFAHRQVDEQPTKRSKTNNDKSAVAMLKERNWQERESVTDVTIDRGNLGREVIRNWDKIHLNVNLLMHDNFVAYFRT